MKTRVLAAAIIAFLVLTGAARAEDKDPFAVSASATYAGRYVWRGITLNNEPALQPGVAISRGGLTVGAWSSIDLTDYGDHVGYGDESGTPTEIDYYASYAIPLGDKVKLSSGFINYTFPHTTFYSTTEVFAGIALDVPASPSITTYLDEDLAEGGNYTSLDLSHSFPLGEKKDDWGLALALGGHVAYANHKYYETYFGLDETPNWSDWAVSAALPISMPAGFSITPSYVYSSMILDDARDTIKDAGLHPDNNVFLISLAWAGEL
jgi:uncharacterized protein (TIGR02001 family)